MSDEAATGSAGTPDGGGRSPRGRGEPAPLQSRAKFLQNWNWASVAQINEGLCERGRAQRGVNTETHAAVAEEWEKRRASELSLLETFQFLKSCHRRAPFLFFNGNTFAEIGRALATALFSNLPFQRRKEVSSAAAHFITGVLDQELMVAAVDSLSEIADWKKGDRVKTLRGSLHGKILRVLDDGKIVWQPDGTKNELTALPENLTREDLKKT
ncbi:MAG TPA: hypothetical protein VK742_17900 [Candidatus Sulfotelmatobacter sp.]|jgi:hypothetical protein|nr:hypothetical protein [Candidatus Sulfotelmatobacter sp.]